MASLGLIIDVTSTRGPQAVDRLEAAWPVVRTEGAAKTDDKATRQPHRSRKPPHVKMVVERVMAMGSPRIHFVMTSAPQLLLAARLHHLRRDPQTLHLHGKCL